jgi:hypothetical protein
MSRDGGFTGAGGEQPPGPDLPAGMAAMVGLVGSSDEAVAAFARGLSDFDLVAFLPGSELIASRAFAARLRMINTLYHRPVMSPPQPSPDDPSGDGDGPVPAGGERRRRRRKGLSAEDLTVAEIQARLCLTGNRAHQLLTMAKALSTRLPATMAGLWGGAVNEYKAQSVVELGACQNFRVSRQRILQLISACS